MNVTAEAAIDICKDAASHGVQRRVSISEYLFKWIRPKQNIRHSLVLARRQGFEKSCATKIHWGVIDVEVYQIEQYSKEIGCRIRLNDVAVFFYEQVKEAIDPRFTPAKATFSNGPYDENDRYVAAVCEFLVRNRQVLFSIPPSWFHFAAEIMWTGFSKSFPDLALSDHAEAIKKYEAKFGKWTDCGNDNRWSTNRNHRSRLLQHA